uniref:Orf5 protein n=1 Tax=Lactobacillus delbrueckii subsp. lactis TaxID=29397 RepID=Q48540_LACDL|nr:orf5 [Lactobacillus delbrueckii subsp. lactis]
MAYRLRRSSTELLWTGSASISHPTRRSSKRRESAYWLASGIRAKENRESGYDEKKETHQQRRASFLCIKKADSEESAENLTKLDIFCIPPIVEIH